MVRVLFRLIGIRDEQRLLFLASFSIIALICVNYYILRSLRNTIAVTFSSAGVELLPAIQFWALLPVTFLVIFLVGSALRKTTHTRAFLFTTLGFSLFFPLFALFLFPIHSQLHHAAHSDFLSRIIPSLGLLLDNWTLALYFIMAELWKVVVLSVLFFGFLNQRLSLASAKGLYSPILLGASIAGLLAGPITVFCSHIGEQLSSLFFMDKWQCSFLLLSIAMTLVGGLICLSFLWLRHHLQSSEITKKVEDKPLAITIKESFKTLLGSPYLVSLGLMVIFEYVAYYLFEVFFLDLLRRVEPDPNRYCAYNGQLIFWSSLLTTFSALVVAPWMLKRCSWRIPALVTPLAIGLLSLPFFICTIFQESSLVHRLAEGFSLSPLQLSLAFGSLLFCVARSAKATLFDSSKEIAFIPLPAELQARGKLVVDGLCSRTGCCLAAAVNQTLFALFSSLQAGIPCAAVLVFGSVSLWIRSVVHINRDLEKRPKDLPATANQPSPLI